MIYVEVIIAYASTVSKKQVCEKSFKQLLELTELLALSRIIFVVVLSALNI